MEELTEEHFQIAASNGISRKNLIQRYWDYGWELERAITQPIRKNPPTGWEEWKETAQANGVNSPLYCQRIRNGMTPEQAATTPVKKYKKHITVPKKRGKYARV